MSKPARNWENEDLHAPAKLVSALRELPREKIFIPPTLDEAILSAAWKHLAVPKPKPFYRFRFIPWAAAVAMVTVLLLLAQLFLRPATKPSRASVFAHEDVNHDGYVDILDAFALARQVQAGQTAGSQLDLNGDGVVDDHDVAIIAKQAVRLEKGGRS